MGGRLFPLADGREYHIGSDPACDLRLLHASVAPWHARLQVEDGIVWLEEGGSSAGTLLNGERTLGASLQPGDVLQVGALRLQVMEVDLPAAGHARLHVRPSFGKRFRYELARAPWFAVSVAVHALLLLLAWVLLPRFGPAPERVLGVGYAAAAAPAPAPPADDEEPLQPSAEDPAMTPVTAPVPVPEPLFAPAAESGGRRDDLPFDRAGLFGGNASLLATVDTGGTDGGAVGRSTAGDLLHSGHKALQGAFGRTVGELRRSGLEIVFVLDSTGSMGRVLAAAKARIQRMVEVLHALVPDARIGVIAFRDRGRGEEYLTRSVRLTRDVWRVINFMQTIGADGGGDREEAVREALQAAFRQPWAEGSRRVVVLIGDAPPHRASESSIRSEVAGFASNGRSFVHTLVTTPYDEGAAARDTSAAFARIAQAGKGGTAAIAGDEAILRQVLSLAIGSEYRRNIDEVYQLVDRRVQAVATWARDLARHPDATRLEQELRREPVADDLVRALARERSRVLAGMLLDLVARADLPESGRQAAGFALQRLLELERPPVDPERGGPPDRAQVALLQQQIQALR